ncbi:MAG: hypothetical protein J6386_16260 [Candidatus Synoicihabitans palmerolidicus]|nr:hypothetical protein [Candidatus Synoicihabitans palmerolidicus]
MIVLRDEFIWATAQGQSLTPDDRATRPLSPVVSNFDRPISYLQEAAALEKFTVPEGYHISLFASEADFPDLANPVQITFDNQGRLWVAVMPSYPHYQPGATRPNDKLLILEDTDGDGRADRQTTFADALHLPIGFALQPDGSVIFSQQPKLIRLRDTDGDDRANETEILLTGFDSHDTHHAIGAFDTGPDGALYMLEGVFLHSSVETPYGTERGVEANVWRFDPRTYRLEKFSAADYANPWAIAFDDYGQTFLSDASNGRNYWLTPMSSRLPHGEQHPEQTEFTTVKVRPTSGSAFVSSRHFPAAHQGDFLSPIPLGFWASNNTLSSTPTPDTPGPCIKICSPPPTQISARSISNSPPMAHSTVSTGTTPSSATCSTPLAIPIATSNMVASSVSHISIHFSYPPLLSREPPSLNSCTT